MKKEQVTHISHNPQPQSLALPPTAKLPLESDPVLKKKFESALKLAGSSVEAPYLATDKNLFDTHALLSEHPFTHSVKKKLTIQPENKTRQKLPITSEEITDNHCQANNNMPYTIMANMAAAKTDKNDKLIPSTSKHKPSIPHLINSLVDKTQPDGQAKTAFFTDNLSTNQAANQLIKHSVNSPTNKSELNNPQQTPLLANTLSASQLANQPITAADLAKPIIISPNDEQTAITYPANHQQHFANKKISSISKPDKLTDRIEVTSQPEKKPPTADIRLDKEKRTENNIEPPSMPVALSAATAEKILTTVDNEKSPASLLNTLFNKLNAVLNVEVNKNYQPPIIQLNLPQIGSLQIKIQQQQQNITIEFVAQTIGQKILLEHRQDLIDKLQRIHPDQHIQLIILHDQQSKERSKEKPQQFDDFEEEMV